MSFFDADPRIPVERLREGDQVRAVAGGPVGEVIDPARGRWTIVEYPTAGHAGPPPTVSYEHGRDQLTLVTAAAATAVGGTELEQLQQLARDVIRADETSHDRDMASAALQALAKRARALTGS